MSVQKGNKQRDLVHRLACRILDHFGQSHRWKEPDMAIGEAYLRATDMTDETLFRYVWWRMRDSVDMQAVVRFKQEVFPGYDIWDDCDVDRSENVSIRDIMIYLLCMAVMDEVEHIRWDYFRSNVAC
jgi:hypothetical protein